jgi:peptidoglycan-associated lipoprotein
MQVQIQGHTDERGTTEYNVSLGERRAKAVKAFLMSRGVSGDRLFTVSFGKERPIDPNAGESAYAKNRRVQFMAY